MTIADTSFAVELLAVKRTLLDDGKANVPYLARWLNHIASLPPFQSEVIKKQLDKFGQIDERTSSQAAEEIEEQFKEEATQSKVLNLA